MSWPVAISSCWGSPTLLSWDQTLLLSFTSRAVCCWTCFLFPVVVLVVFVVLGCYPSAPCCCLSGAHLDASRITAPLPWKDSRQSVVSAVAVRAFCLLGSDLLSLQAQGLLNQKAILAWLNVQLHNCCAHKGALYLTIIVSGLWSFWPFWLLRQEFAKLVTNPKLKFWMSQLELPGTGCFIGFRATVNV